MTTTARLAHHYALLGLTPDADPDAIKRAWKRLAARWHPDLDPRAPRDRFDALREAWDLLSDPARRAAYDAALQAGIDARLAEMGRLSGVQRLGGVLARVIGVKAREARPGRNRRLRLSVALAEAVHGTERDVHLETDLRCEPCDATGAAPAGRTWVCAACAGIGEVLSHGAVRSAWVGCEACAGLGWVPEPPCPACGGKGSVPGRRLLRVPIPAGTADGRVLKIAGQGEPSDSGGPPGDLLVQIEVRPHAHLSPRGKDLLVDRAVPFWLALVGGVIEVPTLDGAAQIRLPPNTRSGDVLRMAGFGLPDGERRGDELVTIRLEWPDALPPEAAAALEAWGRALPPERFPESHALTSRLAASAEVEP